MRRCVVSLLLVPCVLLIQATPLAHAHGGRQPAGHGHRPHVHTAPARAGHTHGHGHHHHDEDDDRGPGQAPPPRPGPVDGHDSDAVYIDAVDLVAGGRAEAHEGVTSPGFPAAVGPLEAGAFLPGPPTLPAARAHPPPRGRSCPLYVRHLSFLI